MSSLFSKVVKYVKEPRKIVTYLNSKGAFRFMGDKAWVKFYYRAKFGKKINLNNPKTYNEKLQWMKIYYHNELGVRLVDKYRVREYIADKIGEEYLIPLLGKYDKFDDINFDILPKRFVIKCNHDSGGLIICRDKDKLNIEEAKKKINKCLKRNYYRDSREWFYKKVKPCIIIEEYMENKGFDGLIDYKFFCFNGEPKCLYISKGLEDHKTAKISFVDLDFKLMPFYRKDFNPFDDISEVPKPKNFEKMKELAKKLSEGFPFIRIDLYEINDKIYFSEFTFYPCSGMIPFYPQEWDEKLGEWLKLPEKE